MCQVNGTTFGAEARDEIGEGERSSKQKGDDATAVAGGVTAELDGPTPTREPLERGAGQSSQVSLSRIAHTWKYKTTKKKKEPK